jgi:hypothetical protein
LFSFTEFCIQAFGVPTHLCFHRAFGVESCDHGYTLRLRDGQSPRFVGWRFDKCVFGSHSKSVSQPHRLHTFHCKRSVKPGFVVGHLVLGLASGLEAFSREPPCDGFGALAFRQTPETRGTAWEFLSYYPRLPSRCLRVHSQLTRCFCSEKLRSGSPHQVRQP